MKKALVCDTGGFIGEHLVKKLKRDGYWVRGVPRYFFSSSACVYRNIKLGESHLSEDDAYPALTDYEYGGEELYAECMSLAFMRNRGIEVRIAQAEDGGTIEVWGAGSAIRAYTYVGDLVDGVYVLTQSNVREPVTIGSLELVKVDQLVTAATQVSGRTYAWIDERVKQPEQTYVQK